MLKIAITGASGLIGSRIIELLGRDFQFISIPVEMMDITNRSDVNKILNSLSYDMFLHLAAYTNVDGAEREKELVYKINVEGTQNVFDTTVNKKAKFIYISTDFVFDGKTPPFTETSIPRPISFYGETKFLGEQVVGNRAMIIRLAYPYRAHYALKKDLVQGIRARLESDQELSMVTDSLITPTFVDDLCLALGHLMKNYSPEVFHLVGGNSMSPFDAGKLIAKTFHLNESLIKPTRYKDYFSSKAKRPQFSLITSQKNNFYKMKTFEEGLSKL